jgi:putative transposase
MRAIYQYTHTTRQNVHQIYQRLIQKEEELVNMEYLMHEIRQNHARMGGLKMFVMLQPKYIGRDRFLNFYNQMGFCIETKRNFKRTTNSSGVIRFPNLVDSIKVTDVNQVWVSDITYYELSGRFYFITFITDQYSRYIVGYKLSARLLTTHTTIPAFKMAWGAMQGSHKPILHSDGGGQYYSKKFLRLTNDKVINSMAESVYENAMAERINGVIKNEYLKPSNPQNFNDLERKLVIAVDKYNCTRPHRSLNFRSPAQVHYGYQQNAGLLTKKKEAKKKQLQLQINH